MLLSGEGQAIPNCDHIESKWPVNKELGHSKEVSIVLLVLQYLY